MAFPFITESVIERWLRSYGSRTTQLLAGVTGIEDLGIAFSGELYQKEIDYLCEKEFARHSQDIFWRRSKLGLNHDTSVVEEVESYLQQKFHAEQPLKATV